MVRIFALKISMYFSNLFFSYKHKIRLLTMSNARNNPGWNYCSYFTVKEGLAFCYYSIGLFEYALEQYASLEQEFLSLFYEAYVKKGGDVYSFIPPDYHADQSQHQADYCYH